MAALTCAVEVDRSPDDVFSYVTDPTRFGEWQANVTSGSTHHVQGGGLPLPPRRSDH
jgi:hypothetical protein